MANAWPSGVICDVALLDLEEAEQRRGIDDGQQVVDFKGELVGQAVDVFAPVGAFVDQLEQSGDAAGARVREYLVDAYGCA